MTLSPTFASIRGIGHSPLMPMVGLSNAPSGLAVTQPMLKSYVTVAADMVRTVANAHVKAAAKLISDFITATGKRVPRY
ncbi:hypothetical protein RRF57_004960 [Xylaria bambusicola]|uniref:Uncharacterized protein n=1 Tax=Xylaria bambusicola TaxID=326684 RepID=A0AAN7UPP3_9PEZI